MFGRGRGVSRGMGEGKVVVGRGSRDMGVGKVVGGRG